MKQLPHFHITYSGRLNHVWPNGCWALYQITGDEIAQRIGFDSRGQVSHRMGWPGYVGTYATLPELMAAVEGELLK